MLASVLLTQPDPMLAPQSVPDPLRLAITPVMDGALADQEWDHFSDTANGPTYLQWEPGKIYWAAKPPAGMDVIVSLDLRGDGWLVGDDNFEIRTTMRGDTAATSIRQLNANDRSGPVWVVPRLSSEAIKTLVRPGASGWTVEGMMSAEGFADLKEDSRVGVRIDLVPSGFETGPAYLPRNLAFARLRFDKSSQLFSGLVWRPSIKNRNIARFDKFNFRFNFNIESDCPTLQQFDVIGEGYARDAINQMTKPFPAADRRGNAFIDYSSEIKGEALGGYRVLRGTILAADGRMATIRTSFRIADLLDFEWDLPKQVRYSQDTQILKGTVTLRSQGTGRIDGVFNYVLPEEWTARRGQTSGFLIYYPRGNAKIPVEFQIPGGASGSYPVTLRAKIGELELTRTMVIMVR